MTKTEMHYLNCDDRDCEKVACVGRRDYEKMVLKLEARVSLLTEALKFAKEDFEAQGAEVLPNYFDVLKKKVQNEQR